MPLSPQIVITPEDIVYKSFAISAVAYTSSTATYTATGHTLSVGNVVMITGIAPDGYNGTYTITGVATNTFTVANTTNTALTDQVGNVYWADATEYEYTGGQSVTYIPNSVDLDDGLSSVEAMVNGKNKIYRQATAPTTGLNTGDVWFDTSDGNKQYYWNGTAWISVQDTAIAAAASAATAAQTTADGKNKIYRQGTSPGTTGNAVGDLWFDTSNDNRISRWDGSSWVQYGLGNAAIANLDAGKISTGYLAAARIQAASLDASVLVAGSITASQIATGTITATQIASGTITTDKLSAGTLTAFTIQTATSGKRVVITTAGNIEFYSSLSGSTQGQIYGGTFTVNGNSAGTLYVYSPAVSGSTQSSILLYSYLSGSTSVYGMFMNGTVDFNNDANVAGELRATYGANNTVTNAANTWISTTGQIRKSTASSLRYKENITEITNVPELDPKLLLSIPVKAFTYKDQYLPNTSDRAGLMVPGFIAEDVDAIYPIAADYDDNQVETWNERFIVPGLLALVQDLDKRVSAIEGGN